MNPDRNGESSAQASARATPSSGSGRS